MCSYIIMATTSLLLIKMIKKNIVKEGRAVIVTEGRVVIMTSDHLYAFLQAYS